MTDLSASDLFASLASELGRLSGTVEGFHDLLALETKTSDASLIVNAQAIDLATQTLGELSQFCANLSADTPTALRLPTAQALLLLRLADLRDRLGREPHTATERQPSEEAFELF